MKILSWILILAGVVLCVVGFTGHGGAWPAAALCFFGSTMATLARNRKK